MSTFRCAALSLVFLGPASPIQAQEAEQFFKNNCAACHTIGNGQLTGPDLKGATARRDRAWLRAFITDPMKVIEGGDQYALALQKESYGMVMPTLPTLTPALVDGLIDYIEQQGGQSPTAAKNEQLVTVPFSPADVDAGRAIFTGRRRLSAGAAACISCHTVRGIGGLGGGQLAPDLTLVYQRLGGRPGLTAWLGAPATPTMRSLFAKQSLTTTEVDPLVAYFEQSAKQGSPDTRAGLGSFALLGLSFAAVGLVVMDTAWKNRRKGTVRRKGGQSPIRATVGNR